MKKRILELTMAALLLVCAYLLSREGALAAHSGAAEEAAVVVVDAGHGGVDPGKVGVGEVEEKKLNLEIARMVQKKLEKSGCTVVMTRETDEGLYSENSQNKKVEELQKRCDLIHEVQPACVVSIHQNSYLEESVSGAQTFYYEHSAEGKALAEAIQTALVEGVDPENHRQAKSNTTYYLLKKTDAPLTIVECGFLSNPEEAELLQQEEYQEKIAAAIAKGVETYLENRK